MTTIASVLLGITGSSAADPQIQTGETQTIAPAGVNTTSPAEGSFQTVLIDRMGGSTALQQDLAGPLTLRLILADPVHPSLADLGKMTETQTSVTIFNPQALLQSTATLALGVTAVSPAPVISGKNSAGDTGKKAENKTEAKVGIDQKVMQQSIPALAANSTTAAIRNQVGVSVMASSVPGKVNAQDIVELKDASMGDSNGSASDSLSAAHTLTQEQISTLQSPAAASSLSPEILMAAGTTVAQATVAAQPTGMVETQMQCVDNLPANHKQVGRQETVREGTPLPVQSTRMVSQTVALESGLAPQKGVAADSILDSAKSPASQKTQPAVSPSPLQNTQMAEKTIIVGAGLASKKNQEAESSSVDAKSEERQLTQPAAPPSPQRERGTTRTAGVDSGFAPQKRMEAEALPSGTKSPGTQETRPGALPSPQLNVRMTTSSVAVDSGLALQSNQPLPTGQTVLDDRRTDNRTAGMRGQEIAVAVPSRPGMLSQAGQAANAPIEVVRSSAPRSTTAANEKKGSIIEALKADNPETQKLNIRSIEVLEEKTAAMGNRATSVPAAASAQAKQGETILSEFPAANPAAIRKNEAQSAGVTGTMVMRSENGTTEVRAIGTTPTLKGTTHLEVLTRLNESPEQRTKPAVSATPAASQQVKDPFVHEALNTENRSQKNAGGVQTEPVEVMKAAAADQPAEAPRGGNLDTRQNDGKQNPKQSQVITSKDDMRPAAKAPNPSPQPEVKTATSIAKLVSTSPQGTHPGGTIAPTADAVNKAASSSDESSPTVKKHTPAQSTDATPTTAFAKPVSASPQATLSGDSISAAAHAVKQAATSREEIHTVAKASEPAANSEIKTATASARPVDSVTPPSQGTPSVDTITAAAHSVRQQIPVITSEARTERTTFATLKSLPDVIVQEVSKAASSLTKETATEIRITLKPESLGEMVVKVSMEDGRVKAEIEVGSASVRAIVEANIPALRDTLISRGVDIQKIDVTTEGDSGSRHASSQQEPRQKGRQDNGVFTSAEQYSAERNMGYNTIELII